MQTSRPTHHITLPLKSGEPVQATIKTPVLKIKRKVQELTVKSISLAEECLETFRLTKQLNERLATQHGSPEEAKVRAERDAVLAKINALNEEQFDIELAQLKLVVNLPNDGDKSRSEEDIDWEAIPEDEIKEAIGFFVNGPKS